MSNSFWSPLFSFDRSKMDVWVGLRSALGVGISMALGFKLGSPTVGLCIALGALNVCYSDRSDSYSFRLRRMLRAALVTAVLVFLSAISAHNTLLALVLVTLLAFAAGYTVVLDTVTADLGVVAIATFVIFGAEPLSFDVAVNLSLYSLLGGLVQMALALGLWPLRRYRPERRALAALFNDISKLAVSSGDSESIPAGSSQSTHAYESLSSVAEDSSPEGRRYRSLLTQAERLRLRLLSLDRLRKRIERESPDHEFQQILSDFQLKESRLLANVAEVIRDEASDKVARAFLQELDVVSAKLRDFISLQESNFLRSVLGDALKQMEGAIGQSRAIIELAERTTSAGLAASNRKEMARPARYRFRATFETLRANFTFESAGFRHAVRLAVCVAVGEVISHMIRLPRSYWVPMTVAIVLKPDFSGTFNRGLLRVGGTIIGLLLATALFHLLPSTPLTEILLMVFFTFVVRSVGSANYGIFAISVSAVVVLLVALTGVAPKDVIFARGVNTLIGGLIAMGAYALWPTWERTQLSEVMARMLEAYRAYWHAVGYSSLNEELFSHREVDRLRQGTRLARSDFHASMGRYLAERGSTPEHREFLAAVTASTNRFAHALVSLEAESPLSLHERQRVAFEDFIKKIDLTLLLLTEALRGKNVPNSEFPDLRAAYVELEKNKASDQDVYSVLFSETDRMTNSLNTSREYILKRLFVSRKKVEPQPNP
ncbi:MAG: FUSC family protein [Bacillota bacterium]